MPRRARRVGIHKCAVDAYWLGCAFAVHENLAGGLIGDSGAILAGWLAWSIVREQVLDTQAARAAIEKKAQEYRLQTLIGERRAFETSRLYLDRLGNALSSGAEGDYCSSLRAADLRGEVVPYSGQHAPDGITHEAQKLFHRLDRLRGQLVKHDHQIKTDSLYKGGIRNPPEIEASLKEVIAETRDLVELANDGVRHWTEKISSLALQLR